MTCACAGSDPARAISTPTRCATVATPLSRAPRPEEGSVTDQPLPGVRPDVPHGARIWNHWLGGKDDYAADRQIAEAVSAVFPGIVDLASTSRRFLTRAVRYLAGEAGIRQFVDVGTGLPATQNTHEVVGTPGRAGHPVAAGTTRSTPTAASAQAMTGRLA
jgi:hypothetical protein